MKKPKYGVGDLPELETLRVTIKSARDQALMLGMSRTAMDLDGKLDAIHYIVTRIERTIPDPVEQSAEEIEADNMWRHEMHGY